MSDDKLQTGSASGIKIDSIASTDVHLYSTTSKRIQIPCEHGVFELELPLCWLCRGSRLAGTMRFKVEEATE